MPTIYDKSIDLSPLRKANVPIIFFLGPPGAGKGTQSEKVVDRYRLTCFSSGDLLRAEVKSGSELGKKADKIMKAGELVSSELTFSIVAKAMVESLDENTHGFLIDGAPRDLRLAKLFDSKLPSCKKVVYFDVSKKTAVRRCLKRAETSERVDDNAKTIKKRFKTFEKKTIPVIKHYEKRGKLVRIKAEKSINSVFTEVTKHLDNTMNNN